MGLAIPRKCNAINEIEQYFYFSLEIGICFHVRYFLGKKKTKTNTSGRVFYRLIYTKLTLVDLRVKQTFLLEVKYIFLNVNFDFPFPEQTYKV